MSYNAKAIIIQLLLIIISGIIIPFKLEQFLKLKELEKLIPFCTFIPFTIFGLYILFGKYVYLKGPVTKPERIGYGLFFLLIVPVLWLIYYFAGRSVN